MIGKAAAESMIVEAFVPDARQESKWLDLLFDIFARILELLPAEAIEKARCTCKAWRQLTQECLFKLAPWELRPETASLFPNARSITLPMVTFTGYVLPKVEGTLASNKGLGDPFQHLIAMVWSAMQDTHTCFPALCQPGRGRRRRVHLGAPDQRRQPQVCAARQRR
jgi:hypothetical protein